MFIKVGSVVRYRPEDIEFWSTAHSAENPFSTGYECLGMNVDSYLKV